MINLAKNENGSVMIESAIVFGFLSLVIAIVFNVAMSFSNKSRLEYISYHLASLVRESSLYANRIFTSEDSENIFRIAEKLTEDFIKDSENLGIRIEFYNYSEDGEENKETFLKGVCESDEKIALSDYIGETENSLVAVTLCLNNQTRFADVYRLFQNNSSSVAAKSLVVQR
ncbi:MAG: hypothetical protein LUC34_01570 [Campylobacter sp.]|nr:hypothetical protein [Campylobacter sp.]